MIKICSKTPDVRRNTCSLLILCWNGLQEGSCGKRSRIDSAVWSTGWTGHDAGGVER